jgi:hypothetical protein
MVMEAVGEPTRKRFRNSAPTSGEVATMLPFFLFLHEVLLEQESKFMKWPLTKEVVKVGYDASCDIIIPVPAIMRHHVRLDSYFQLLYQKKAPHWLVEIPREFCHPLHCKPNSHNAQFLPGVDVLIICVGCGCPPKCCPSHLHPELLFTIEVDSSSDLQDRQSKIPTSPRWFVELSLRSTVDVLTRLLPSEPELAKYAMGRRISEWFKARKYWFAMRCLHLQNLESVKNLLVPPRPLIPGKERELYFRLLASAKFYLESRNPGELMNLPSRLRVLEKFILHWKVPGPQHDIGTEILGLKLPHEVRAGIYKWSSQEDGETIQDEDLNPSDLPKPLGMREFRYLLEQTPLLRVLTLRIPVAGTVWKTWLDLRTGTLQRYLVALAKLEECHITFFDQEDRAYPSFLYLGALYWLRLVSVEEDSTPFWSWLFNDQKAVLPRLATLHLASWSYIDGLLNDEQNWRNLARKTPKLGRLQIQFFDHVEGREDKPLKTLIQRAWPGLNQIYVWDPAGSMGATSPLDDLLE